MFILVRVPMEWRVHPAGAGASRPDAFPRGRWRRGPDGGLVAHRYDQVRGPRRAGQFDSCLGFLSEALDSGERVAQSEQRRLDHIGVGKVREPEWGAF
jgi:hypothetical protein